MTVFYLRRPGEAVHGGPRVGLTVGRVLGGAVLRNRIRRRMREAVRRQIGRLGVAVDVVINPKKSVLQAGFPELLNEVGSAFGAVSQRLQRSAARQK